MKQVLAIAGVLAGTAAAAFGLGEHGRKARLDPDRLREELGLTEAQASGLRQLWLDRVKQGIRRRADIAIARLELKALLDASKVDEKAISAKAQALSELQAAALRSQVDARLAVRKLLSAEQYERLKDHLRQRRESAREEHRLRRRGERRREGREDDVLEEPALTADEGR